MNVFEAWWKLSVSLGKCSGFGREFPFGTALFGRNVLQIKFYSGGAFFYRKDNNVCSSSFILAAM